MPNGHDREWVRFCGAVDGFRSRYGRWPARVRLWPGAIEVIRDHILTADGFAQVTAKVELVPDEDAPYIAEDAAGERYSYGGEGFPGREPDIRAEVWFGNPPHRDPDADLRGISLVE
ncbi:MAG: hypothetical protein ACR2FY_00890 [Pirellulaceae bacterium]